MRMQHQVAFPFIAFKCGSFRNWRWGDFTNTPLTHALLPLPHLHSSLSIMHMQHFRAEIDASMSRLFPWILSDSIHFSALAIAGLKPKHVGSGGASGPALPRKKKNLSHKWGTQNVSFYPSNFRFPISQSSGSDSHLGVMHISFRAEDCLLHNV